MAKAEEAESKPIKQEPVELPQSLSEVYHGPTRNFHDVSRSSNDLPGIWERSVDSNVHLWNCTTPAPYRLWPPGHPALYNSAFVVLQSLAENRTTIFIPSNSILRPIFQKERIHMDEAYMLLEHTIQKGCGTHALESIQFEFAHCLRHEYFFVRNTDPRIGLKNDSLEFDKILWAKEEDLLHRRRYLELLYHSLNLGIIMFPNDPSSHLEFSLQKVLDLENNDEVRLKLMEAPCDAFEPRYAFRTLRKDDLIGSNKTYILLNATYRHPDEFDGKIKLQIV